ncbi:MAG: hypothetical protein OEX77_09490 [Candidatus Bathyarchaeota archaeon]|nr:hypothetical protein [Candidatus Bathyarchaeota archaeon]MDH5733464.1 hypothetical protein [Candidatus Bathyarchaeota archaeon]
MLTSPSNPHLLTLVSAISNVAMVGVSGTTVPYATLILLRNLAFFDIFLEERSKEASVGGFQSA